MLCQFIQKNINRSHSRVPPKGNRYDKAIEILQRMSTIAGSRRLQSQPPIASLARAVRGGDLNYPNASVIPRCIAWN
jgi:hypothetical protein